MLAIPLSSGHPVVTAALAALTKSLARPVTCGLLPERHAHAAIAVALARIRPPEGDIAGQLKAWIHVLELHIRQIEVRRDLARHRILSLLRPLIALHRPWNILMAEAHDQNGAEDFPLTEQEVSDLVRKEVWFALPPAPRRQAHGR